MDDVVRRFITPTSRPEINPPVGQPEDASVEDFATFEGGQDTQDRPRALRSDEIQAITKADEGRKSVKADFERIEEERHKTELVNKDELAGTASRMLAATMSDGRDWAIADKDLYWKVANEYFGITAGKFDFEVVTRLYLNARDRKLSAGDFNSTAFDELVPLTQQQIDRDPNFKKFIGKHRVPVTTKKFKEDFGSWFKNPDKQSYRTISNDDVAESLSAYKKESVQTDVSILERLNATNEPAVAAPTETPAPVVNAEMPAQVGDVLTTAAELLNQRSLEVLTANVALLTALLETLLQQQTLPAVEASGFFGDATVQVILGRYYETGNLSEADRQTLRTQLDLPENNSLKMVLRLVLKDTHVSHDTRLRGPGTVT